MKYSGDPITRFEAEEVSPFMKNFLELKNKKEALLRSSGLGTLIQTAGSTSSFSFDPAPKMSQKHEQELKNAYLVHPTQENNENSDPNSTDHHPRVFSHYTDEDDEV